MGRGDAMCYLWTRRGVSPTTANENLSSEGRWIKYLVAGDPVRVPTVDVGMYDDCSSIGECTQASIRQFSRAREPTYLIAARIVVCNFTVPIFSSWIGKIKAFAGAEPRVQID